jgi:hypothetical protein
VHGLNVQIARNSLWAHPMELIGDFAQVEARFGLLRDSVNIDAK